MADHDVAFWCLYFLCSAIRSNIGIAQTMNVSDRHDLMSVLHMTPKDTSTALALFYVSYVIFDLPSNLVMSRLNPRVWMARIVFATSLVGTCFAAVQSVWSLKLLRFLLGMVIAGMWPGMAYYLTLFYPPSRTGKRIGMYFTASQVSAAVVGLVSAGFQLMDSLGGLAGFRWMFLIYGLVGIVLSFALLWWLPDRPLAPGQVRHRSKWLNWLPHSPEALTGDDAIVHYQDLRRVYHPRPWTIRDLVEVLLDWRLWPLTLMYFGVVGVGIGTQLYGSVIIAAIQPTASAITVSLLFAPIWIVSWSIYPPPREQSANCPRLISLQSSSSRPSQTASTASEPSSSPPQPASKLPGSSSPHSPLTDGPDTAVCSWSASALALRCRFAWHGPPKPSSVDTARSE